MRNPLTEEERRRLAADPFGDMFKLAVDVTRGVAAVGGDFHADAERVLLDGGSAQADVWGANYYPARPPGNRLEYSALINVRPASGNRGHLIESEEVRLKVREIAERLVGPS